MLAPVRGWAVDMAADSHVRRYTITTDDGVRLAVEDSGPVDAEHNVFFAHGLCLSQLAFAPQKRLLRRRFGKRVRMVSVDHRGHGRSDSAAIASYTIAQLGRDVLKAAGLRLRSTKKGFGLGARMFAAANE